MPKIIGIRNRIEKPYNPEDDVKTAEKDSPEPEQNPPEEKHPPTLQEIDEYFTTQGEMIEAQLHDGGAYPNCPVCTHAKQSLEEIVKLLRASLSELDKAEEADRQEGTTSTLGIYNRMRAELPWFELARSITLAMAQSGHMPNRVMNQHPDLVVTKQEKRAMKSGKHKRKLSREARRQNRG